VVENLPAGDYRVGIRAVGYSAAAKSGLKLTVEQNLPSQDFALATGMVKWTDISILQDRAAAERPRQERAGGRLHELHGFQSKMAAVTPRDLDGFRSRVEYMREAMRSSLADRRASSDQQAEDIAYYMNKMFGYDSVLPKSPASCRPTRAR